MSVPSQLFYQLKKTFQSECLATDWPFMLRK